MISVYLIYRYLEGDQLRGKASVQAYINALKNGCRCVERKSFQGKCKIKIQIPTSVDFIALLLRTHVSRIPCI